MRSEVAKFGFRLFVIAATAGLSLGATNAVTEAPIRLQQAAEANAARLSVLPGARDVAPYVESAEDPADVYVGRNAAGELVGYAGKTLVNGFGGPIEVTVGISPDGRISGVHVGGTDFAETAGLGARTREDWFTGQYAGKAAPVALKKDGGSIDAVTSATVSSAAVTGGVNAVANYLTTWIGEGE